MAVTWLLLIALGMLAEGRRVPRQHMYNGPMSYSRTNVAKATTPGIQDKLVAICSLQSSLGHHVTGEIVLKQKNPESPVDITGAISGLSEGKHGIHIHQNANTTNNCTAAGSHFNPNNKTHGGPEDSERHVGDLGNILVGKNGVSDFHILDKQISLHKGSTNLILGRSIVIHEKEDDLGKGSNEESKKTGNAGARVACCVIEPIARSIY